MGVRVWRAWAPSVTFHIPPSFASSVVIVFSEVIDLPSLHLSTMMVLWAPKGWCSMNRIVFATMCWASSSDFHHLHSWLNFISGMTIISGSNTGPFTSLGTYLPPNSGFGHPGRHFRHSKSNLMSGRRLKATLGLSSQYSFHIRLQGDLRIESTNGNTLWSFRKNRILLFEEYRE